MRTRSIIPLLALLAGVVSPSIEKADAQSRHGSYQGGPRDYGSHHQPFHPLQSFHSRYAPSHRGSNKGGSCHSHRRTEIRLIAGHQCGKPNRPCGWHPIDWFHRRGYNLDNYSFVYRDGTVRHGRRVRR